MAYKQPSSGSSFKMMGSSPAKKPGIFEGEGESRVRISKEEADKKEADGATNITRTAADNPDKEEGKQQIMNLGTDFSKFDADLQNRSNRNMYDPNLFLAMGREEPLLAEGAEKKIRKHENLKGGNPLMGEKTYTVNGKTMNEKEMQAWREKQKNIDSLSSETTTDKDGTTTTTTTMTPKQYRAWLKTQNN